MRAQLPWILITLIFLIVIVPAPGSVLNWAAHDDGLFFHWSLSILDGQWLGEWNQFTTSKGPLHSMAVAMAAAFGVNPFAYKRLFHLLAAIIMVQTALPRDPGWIRILALVTLLTDPFQYGGHGLRNLREGTYVPLQMVAFGLGSLLLRQLSSGQRWRFSQTLTLAGMAACFGLMLITREAGSIVKAELLLWILLAGALLVQRHRPVGSPLLRMRSLAMVAMAGVLILTLMALPATLVSSLNAHAYGTGLANSVEEGYFPKLYTQISNLQLENESYRPRVPVTKTILRAADAELSDAPGSGYLNPILQHLHESDDENGCHFYSEICGELAGGWMQWILRDAIAKTLAIKDEKHFQIAAREASKELQELCRSSTRLSCTPRMAGYLPMPRRWGYPPHSLEPLHEVAVVVRKTWLPEPFPLGQADLSPADFNRSGVNRQELERLRLRNSEPRELITWQRRFVGIQIMGSISKGVLLILALAAMFLTMHRGRFRILCDPVLLWLVGSIAIQCTVYSLVSITSFRGDVYTLMASPLVIIFYARLLSEASIPNHEDIGEQRARR